MKKNAFFLLLVLGAIVMMATSASAQRPRIVITAPPDPAPQPVLSPD